jgi:serine/threonine protein kinase/Tol biopolymer transport system component
MALAPGTKLGPYEIQSSAGAGGMGEVYKARDTRLDRTVAIKVLPTHLSANPELRARFEREAKAISALQHSNICVLYDVGVQNDIDFLVMEYLEGETLYTRLARKPLTPDEAVKIAIEIADALEKAHRSGIVHRDLKPGNVMLTKAGSKLMDFGLAKPLGLAGGSGPKSGTPNVSSMATMAATMADLASPVTVAGTLVGTVQYMSPEQIQGKDADARSDIFAFGAMLYEMLSGKRAFQGKSQLSLASAILERDPDPLDPPPPLKISPALEQVVRTCLAKDPDDRFQSAHDVKLQLQWISSSAASASQTGAPAVSAAPRKKSSPALAAALVAGWLLAIVAAALVFLYAGRLTSAHQTVHASIQQPAGFDFAPVAAGAPVFSPDGQQIAFLGYKKGTSFRPTDAIIFLQRLSAAEAIPLAGTQGALFPFWSPDGKYLAFFADAKLKKIPVAGGPAQIICDAPDGRGGSWNEQGTIIFAPRIAGALQSVSDGGGTPTDITAAPKDDAQFTDRNPYFLPDGNHFLFVQRGKDGLGRVYAGSLDRSQPKELLPQGSNVAYSEGYLFYVKDGALIAQEFDPSSLTFKSKPISIAAAVEYNNARNQGYFSVSRNLLLYRAPAPVNNDLASYDSTGKELDHWGDPGPYVYAQFFPSTQTVMLGRTNSGGNGISLWLSDVSRRTVNRLTPDLETSQFGVVSPDGKDVWVSTTTGYVSSLTRKSLAASGEEEKVIDKFGGHLIIVGISRDGRYLLFDHQDPKTDFDVYAMDLQGERKLVPVLNSPAWETVASLSPDSKWLAYTSNESGAFELFVTSFPVPGTRWQISTGGISGGSSVTLAFASWSPDGKFLRFRKGDKVFEVEARFGGAKPEFSQPKELVTLPPNLNVFSILADGKHIFALRPSGDSVPTPMDFVLNWEHLVK